MSQPTQAGALHLTISLGVASVPRSRVHSAKGLVVTADKALYRAKRAGRNQVQAERRQDGLERPARGRAAQSETEEPRTEPDAAV